MGKREFKNCTVCKNKTTIKITEYYFENGEERASIFCFKCALGIVRKTREAAVIAWNKRRSRP